MRERMIQTLQGTKAFDLTNLPDNTVIVADEIKPSMTASMDIAHVAGIVAEKGGDTAHASILARALEIPAVLSVKGILQKVKNGDSIIIDGAYGEVFINPTQRTFSIYEKKKKKYEEHIEELKTFINKSTETADGKKVMLAANIGGADEAAKAVKAGAEGVGLFRTEFLFLNKNALPTEEEQFEAYSTVAKAMDGKEVIIRTLDVGGDKDIPYLNIEKEENPFLGHRAIRYCLDNKELFKKQLRALLRASVYGNIKIMFPLVTCVEEVRQAKSLIEECKEELKSEGKEYRSVDVGIMVETPAAVFISDILAREVKFFSIGTNDLTGYTMAVDRGNAKVERLYDVFQPSVLRAIETTIKNAKAAGIQVGMCGEAAADTKLIPYLIEWGLDEFSVSSGSILQTRKTICEYDK